MRLSERGYLQQFCRIWSYPTFHSLLFLHHLVSPPGTAQQTAQHGLIHCLTPNLQCHPGTHLWPSSTGATAAFQALLPPKPCFQECIKYLGKDRLKINIYLYLYLTPCYCIGAPQKGLTTLPELSALAAYSYVAHTYIVRVGSDCVPFPAG